MKILASFDAWRRVKDVDGTVGWMHRTQLSDRRSVLFVGFTKSPLRSDSDPKSKIVAYAAPGVVAWLKACEPSACDVEASGTEGWVDKRNIWEWTRVKSSNDVDRALRLADSEARVAPRGQRSGDGGRARRSASSAAIAATGLAAWLHRPRRDVGDGRTHRQPARADLLGGVRMGTHSLCASRHDLSVRALLHDAGGRRSGEGAGIVGGVLFPMAASPSRWRRRFLARWPMSAGAASRGLRSIPC